MSYNRLGEQPGDVHLYGRIGCHRCEESELVLAKLAKHAGFTWRKYPATLLQRPEARLTPWLLDDATTVVMCNGERGNLSFSGMDSLPLPLIVFRRFGAASIGWALGDPNYPDHYEVQLEKVLLLGSDVHGTVNKAQNVNTKGASHGD